MRRSQRNLAMYRRCCLLLMLTLVLSVVSSVYATAPTYVAAGNVMQYTGAILIPWPAHQAGDVALLVVESANQTISLSVPAGFTEVTGSPQGTGTTGGTSATRLAVFWKRATSSSEEQPAVADSGDHQIARIFTFRGVIASGNPWDVTAGDVASTASTAVSIPGATTTVPDTLVAVIVSNITDTTIAQTTNVTNANLTSLAMCKDNNTSQGNGGGFGIWAGVKAAAGAYGTTTATLKNSSVQGRFSIALKPAVSGPGAATSPSPANGATNVGITTDLSWTAGAGTTSHNVYFGTTNPGAYIGNQTDTTYDTGIMTNNTTYYWRIDEVNASGTTTGTVWNFTTIVALPGAASNPSPANSATDVGITTDLSWTAGSGVASHNVYFGTTSPGVSQGNQTATTFDTGTMVNSTVYYWRIDEVNAAGTTTGTVWSFTTAASVTLAISSVSPATYTVQYDSLATGQLVYIDRTYTFTNVASLGGCTYIKTANADKSTTTVPWLTFNINQSCTVYVGHDDVITTKPSWMSTWTDTGANLFHNGSTNNFSLYSKVFSTGTVSIGGNAGGASSSMYIVVVVPIGTSAPEPATNPSPANGATGIWLDTNLSWTAGSGAASHNVYFGTDSTPDSGELKGNQFGTSYDPSTMSADTTYYWRIDEVNSNGTTTGTIWSFTTGDGIAELGTSSSGHYVTYHGQTLMLVGDSGTQCAAQNSNLDHREWIDDCYDRGIRVIHVWTFIPVRQKQDGTVKEDRWGYVVPDVMPWARNTSGSLALDQKYDWNLQAFDEGSEGDFTHYWPRMRDLCSYARDRNMLVGITMFTGWAKPGQDPWDYHPLNSTNGGHLTSAGDAVTIASPGTEVWQETYSGTWSNAKKTQWVWEKLSIKIINDLGSMGNVFFVFFDEHSYDDGNMETHFRDVFRGRGMVWVDEEDVRSTIDWVMSPTLSNYTDKNSQATDGFMTVPVRPYFNLEGAPYMDDEVRTGIWTFSIGGAHYIFHADCEQETARTGIMGYDPYVPSGDKGMYKRDWVGYASRFFNEYLTLNLDEFSPWNSLVGSGAYCLAEPGIEYAVYSKIGYSSITVNLSAASGKTMNCRFYDPRDGLFNSTFQRAGGSSSESFTKPSSDDWILHIVEQ